jgi:MoaA/NifB/PqqE/SkfB family radical SAM enzyme
MADEILSMRELATRDGLSLVWDLPVPFSSQNPFELEFTDVARPSGAGKAWLYVEPDGDVLPDQSIHQVIGNILNDPWDSIWQPVIEKT